MPEMFKSSTSIAVMEESPPTVTKNIPKQLPKDVDEAEMRAAAEKT